MMGCSMVARKVSTVSEASNLLREKNVKGESYRLKTTRRER